MAPRHPPRALCSLTSLSNSPKGSCRRKAGIITLSLNLRQKSKFKKDLNFFRSRLHFVRCCEPKPALSSDPLVGDLQVWPGAHGSGGHRVGHHKTARRPRAVLVHSQGCALRERPGSTRSSIPSSGVRSADCVPHCVRGPAGLVETRRLELLTLSLQRRCSSN